MPPLSAFHLRALATVAEAGGTAVHAHLHTILLALVQGMVDADGNINADFTVATERVVLAAAGGPGADAAPVILALLRLSRTGEPLTHRLAASILLGSLVETSKSDFASADCLNYFFCSLCCSL